MVIILGIAILVIVFGVVLEGKNKSLQLQTSKKTSELNLNLSEIVLKDREVKIIDGNLYVGNNEKEIENGFFDIKIEDLKVSEDINECNIYFNKLWYENYGTDYIQDEYLAEICRQIVKAISKKQEMDDFEYELYKYVKDNYMDVLKEEYKEINFGNIVLKGARKDNVFLVKLVSN